MQDVRHIRSGHVVFASQINRAFALLMALSYVANVILGHFCSAVRRAETMIASSTSFSISHIVGLISEIQMIWIATKRHVAFVQDKPSLGYFTVRHLVGDSVGLVMLSSNDEVSVEESFLQVWCGRRRPQPTFLCV